MRKSSIAAFIGGALLVVSLGVVAQQSGGFPSRPRFASVGVGAAAPAGTGSINITGSYQVNGAAIGMSCVFKTANTDMTNNAIPAVDPHLQFANIRAPNKRYRMTANLIILGGTGLTGFRWGIVSTNNVNLTQTTTSVGTWYYPRSNVVVNGQWSQATTGIPVSNGSTANNTLSPSNETIALLIDGMFIDGATVSDPSFAITWAQSSATANLLRVHAGSYMCIEAF